MNYILYLIGHRLIRSLMVLFFIGILSFSTLSQNISFLNFQLHTPSGDSISVKDYLEYNKNYVISFMGWWNASSQSELEWWKPHYNDWKSRYNIEIIVIDLSGYFQKQWSFEKYEALGLPYSFFISFDEDQIYFNDLPVNLFIGKIKNMKTYVTGAQLVSDMEELLRANYNVVLQGCLEKELNQQFIAETSNDSLMTTELRFARYKTVEDTLYKVYKFKNTITHQIEEHLFRETYDFKHLYYYDQEAEQEYLIADMSLGMCDTFRITHLGEEIITRVEDVYFENDRKHIELNFPVKVSLLGEENLTFIEGVGTNAGLLYKGDESGIYSYLLCSSKGDTSEYTSTLFGDHCNIFLVDTETTSLEENFEMSPNPFLDYISVKTSLDPPFTYRFIDLTGKSTLSGIISSEQLLIDVTTLPVGVWILELAKQDGPAFRSRLVKVQDK